MARRKLLKGSVGVVAACLTILTTETKEGPAIKDNFYAEFRRVGR